MCFVNCLNDDPKVLTAIQLTLWLPYPVIRLAWFFATLISEFGMNAGICSCSFALRPPDLRSWPYETRKFHGECKQVPFRMLSIAAVIIFVMVMLAHVDAAVDPSDAIDGSQIDQVGEQVMRAMNFVPCGALCWRNCRKQISIKDFCGGALEWVGRQDRKYVQCDRRFLPLAVQRFQRVLPRQHLRPQLHRAASTGILALGWTGQMCFQLQ